MKAKEILINWLEEMVEKHPPVHYKYGYCKEISDFIVCAYNENDIKDGKGYIDDIIALYDSIDDIFIRECVLFAEDEEEFYSYSMESVEEIGTPSFVNKKELAV